MDLLATQHHREKLGLIFKAKRECVNRKCSRILPEFHNKEEMSYFPNPRIIWLQRAFCRAKRIDMMEWQGINTWPCAFRTPALPHLAGLRCWRKILSSANTWATSVLPVDVGLKRKILQIISYRITSYLIVTYPIACENEDPCDSVEHG